MQNKKTSKLKAADLKKKFGVYGYFYDLDINGIQYACRSVLELVSHDVTPLLPNDLFKMPPDLYCIMMNPGSSRPLNIEYKPQVVQSELKIYHNRELIETQPDNTQYQLLRLLDSVGWHHARVLNLSDLREPKSVKFLATINSLDQVSKGGVHSIFSNTRHKELKAIMNPEHPAPVLLAWGRDKGLLPLAQQCLSRIQDRPKIGLPTNDEQTLFAHASPMLQSKKDEWLLRIVQKLIQLV